MRKGFTSEIDTFEISDSELDTISGGIASAGIELAGRGGAVSIGDVVGTAQSLAAEAPVSQLASAVTVHTVGI
ncbi:hypothetical protein AB0D04_07590 [Streptomyces sp. NPDC048483]|uniref:hypothetical protein n=1 Tax=Streptomyces sp. NPDC048483 TaxID=3154927 RepID=UPI003424B948